MNLSWTLAAIDPLTLDATGGPTHCPVQVDFASLDALLVGSHTGPLHEFFSQQREIANDGARSTHVMSPKAVRALANRLSAIDPADYASVDSVLEESGTSVKADDKEHFHRFLVDRAMSLQHFVNKVAEEGSAIRCDFDVS